MIQEATGAARRSRLTVRIREQIPTVSSGQLADDEELFGMRRRGCVQRAQESERAVSIRRRDREQGGHVKALDNSSVTTAARTVDFSYRLANMA